MYSRQPSAHKSAAERVRVEAAAVAVQLLTWRPYQHARMHVRHLRRAVHERGEALDVFFFVCYITLVLQHLSARESQSRALASMLRRCAYPVARAGAAEVAQSAFKVRQKWLVC